jgi:ketosteroid isomerase-like protein
MDNHQIIEQFYQSFAAVDANGMTALYHDEIVFKDPAFGTLSGDRAKSMWKMLLGTQTKETFQVVHNNVRIANNIGHVNWIADYTFSSTGRKIRNKVKATFKFKDGLIIEHSDEFDLHKWASQALGFKGMLIGWTSFFKSKLQNQTNGMLDRFVNQNP